MDAHELRRLSPEWFETERVRLEKIHESHAAVLRESVLRSRADLQYVDWSRGEWGQPQARRFCRGSRQTMELDGRFLTYLVFERQPWVGAAKLMRRGPYVGLLDLHEFDWAVPACQIGYVGDSAQRGRGLMREATLALIDQAFAWGLHRIEAWCDARNERSIRFARGVGMQLEGRLRSAGRDVQGLHCDQVVLARLAGDPMPAPSSAQR